MPTNAGHAPRSSKSWSSARATYHATRHRASVAPPFSSSTTASTRSRRSGVSGNTRSPTCSRVQCSSRTSGAPLRPCARRSSRRGRHHRHQLALRWNGTCAIRSNPAPGRRRQEPCAVPPGTRPRLDRPGSPRRRSPSPAGRCWPGRPPAPSGPRPGGQRVLRESRTIRPDRPSPLRRARPDAVTTSRRVISFLVRFPSCRSR